MGIYCTKYPKIFGPAGQLPDANNKGEKPEGGGEGMDIHRAYQSKIVKYLPQSCPIFALSQCRLGRGGGVSQMLLF